MIINISISTDKKTEVYDVVEKIHNCLAGNKDYIDSNVVLNFDNSSELQTINLSFDADKCSNRDFVYRKVKQATAIFIDNIDGI